MTNTIDPISYNAGIEAAAKIDELYQKLAASPLGMTTTWERKASGGKPLLYGGKRGLLAYGTIATWDEFDFIAAVANEWPKISEALRSLQRPEPQTAPASIVTCCVTGSIPGDGGACGDCDPCLMGEASVPDAVKRLIAEKNSLIARIGELEGTLAGVAGVDNIAPTPAAAERLALAERIEKHVNVMANTSMHLSLEQWGDIANDLLTASAALRAGGWREDMENGRHGFIVSSADETRFRFWDAMGPTWTTDRVRALRFARRIDAERFAAEDEDAWKILEVAPSAPKNTGG